MTPEPLTDTPLNRAARAVVAAVLLLTAVGLFVNPVAGMATCEASRRDPRATATERRRACERWIWRDVAAAALLVPAARLLHSALRRR